ncbi:isochorismatase domain-containing protein 2 [Magnaporthiopsis poae ATCC 64411]|uniref:Isochorismatase domain-containing protein 2 n=1 Tax=Magnaporthiopsis poae (strain ATCC 64411 / 73-15) TaxID=644358 RepID=A0A0C4CSH9_MAGP6|nr:isochorismatase domain-containing protein 2, variant [Magnaporthiopsis poae ATCC 64411]KLU88984.1 isochorismatase domain-containing protein 2 [Magnaporthiopsis poae ATCC 64411]
MSSRISAIRRGPLRAFTHVDWDSCWTVISTPYFVVAGIEAGSEDTDSLPTLVASWSGSGADGILPASASWRGPTPTAQSPPSRFRSLGSAAISHHKQLTESTPTLLPSTRVVRQPLLFRPSGIATTTMATKGAPGTTTTTRRLENPVVFVCDIQEKFRNAIWEFDKVESWLYEVMGDAAVPEFRAIVGLVKETSTDTAAVLKSLLPAKM